MKIEGFTLNEVNEEITSMGLDHTLNIYQRMLMAQTKLDSVEKNSTVGKGDNQYKAVTERDILDAVKKVEKECGIYSFPFSRKTIELKETTTKYGAITQWIRIKTKYRFINVDNPKDFIEVDTFGDGADALDKGPGKAMTYADKYALMKAYKISTGEDPDKDYSEEQIVPQQEPPKEKSIDELAIEFQAARNKLFDLSINIHSEIIEKWMKEKTGYSDQEISLTDIKKTKDILTAYNALISKKEKAKDNEKAI